MSSAWETLRSSRSEHSIFSVTLRQEHEQQVNATYGAHPFPLPDYASIQTGFLLPLMLE